MLNLLNFHFFFSWICCLKNQFAFLVSIMLSQLHIPSNLKFKYFFGGQVPSKPLHLMNLFLSMHLHPFIWVRKKTNYKTLNWQLLHLKIIILFIKCLNPLKTSTLLLLRMCMLFIPKIRKRLVILTWPMSFKSLDSENAISKTHFQWSWHGYFYQIKDNFSVV
jgi:hypothetical protein